MRIKKNKLLCLCLSAALLLAAGVGFAFASGLIVADRSAERMGDGFVWQDVRYVSCSGDYTEGRTLAKTTDGWRINAVREDDSHTFLVIRSFLDQQLCVRADYVIPQSGRLTAVWWAGKRIEDDAFCTAVSEILSSFRPERIYTTEHIETLTDTQRMKDISFCYEDCPPVGIDPDDCYMGRLDEQWVFARRTTNSAPPHGEPRSYDICTIPAKYTDILIQFGGKALLSEER